MGFSDRAQARVDEERKFVEKIAGLVPGYHGYQNKEKIRETDRLVRDELTRILKISVGNLSSCFSILTTSGSVLTGDIDRMKLKADRISEKVRHAEYGYAGLFDPIKIHEEELDALLKFDGCLVDDVKNITESSQNLLKLTRDGENLKTTLAALDSALDSFDDKFGERKQFMQGLKG